METSELTKMMMEVKEDVAEIKTGIKFMLENCKQEKACVEDIDVRLEHVETRFNEIDGAWKLFTVAVSLGVSSFIWAVYNWAKIRFGV